MTGRQVLGVLARLSARAVREAWRRELLERLAFRDADLDRRIREYSSGMKRKLAIVSAFQADAPLLVLDEPTEGLDPLMQEAFYALLADVRQRGTTVFLSSHVLSEVDRAVRSDRRAADRRTGARGASRAGEADGAAAGARRDLPGTRGAASVRMAGIHRGRRGVGDPVVPARARQHRARSSSRWPGSRWRTSTCASRASRTSSSGTTGRRRDPRRQPCSCATRWRG